VLLGAAILTFQVQIFHHSQRTSYHKSILIQLFNNYNASVENEGLLFIGSSPYSLLLILYLLMVCIYHPFYYVLSSHLQVVSAYALLIETLYAFHVSPFVHFRHQSYVEQS